MRIYATITAKDSPSAGYYQARTCFGRVFSGVSLKGPAHPLNVGQQVAVFEVGAELSSIAPLGEFPAILAVPGDQIESFCKQAPAKASLAYIAHKAGNVKQDYVTAAVTGLSGTKLVVAGKISGIIGTSGVNASDFTPGDTVLIDRSDKTPAVIGWWSLKAAIEVKAAFLHRPFFTARAELHETVIVDNVFEVRRSLVFNNKNPLSVRAVLSIQQTTDADDYYYCTATMLNAAFQQTEFYYLAFSKDYTHVLELTEGEYPPPPPVPYSRTVDNKFWWSRQEDVYCLQSDTVDGPKSLVFRGEWDNEGLWLPSKGQVYSA